MTTFLTTLRTLDAAATLDPNSEATSKLEGFLIDHATALIGCVEALEKSMRRCRACYGEGMILVNDDDPMGGGMNCPECAQSRRALAALEGE